MTVRKPQTPAKERLQLALVAVAERYLAHVKAHQGMILQGDISDVLASFASASSFVLMKSKAKSDIPPTAH